MKPHTTPEDDAFLRDLAEVRSAYRNASVSTSDDGPRKSVDDAIRAAARRAVHAGPGTRKRPWVNAWSRPLSAAALVVLTATITMVAIDDPVYVEKQVSPLTVENIPAAPAKAANAKLDAAVEAVADTTAKRIAPTGKSSETAISSEGRAKEKRTADARVAQAPVAAATPNPAAPPVYAPPAPALVPPPEVRVAESVAAPVATPSVAPAVAAAPLAALPPPAPLAARALVGAASAIGAVSEKQEKLARRENIATSSAEQKRADTAITLSGTALKDATSNEPADAWIQRILVLQQQGKTHEAAEELAKLLKRYPDVRMPEALRKLK